MLEKTLESPLACKEIQPVHPKGDQSWVFIGKTDVEAETPNFGHLMRRADSFEKTLMLGKNITCILLIISNTRSIDQGVVEIYKEWRRCTSEPRELNSSVGWFNTHIDIHIHTYVCISYIIGLDVDVSIF